LAIRDTVAFDDAGEWCEQVFAALHALLGAAGVEPAGPDGALYYDDFFEAGEGQVVAFVPVGGDVVDGGRASVLDLDESRTAVMVHDGPFADLDRTYGALGTVVASRGVGRPGPIREHYVTDERTEVCWPIEG
jgi:effector-binding domain-containing protein